MASIAAVAVLATIICLLVVTFLGVLLYHVICAAPGDGDADVEAIRKRRKTPKKHNNIPMPNIDSRKSESKRRKEEQKRLKQEEKERKRREKEMRNHVDPEESEVVMREKRVSRDMVPRMASQYESTMERDKMHNRLSRVSERSSKKSNSYTRSWVEETS